MDVKTITDNGLLKFKKSEMEYFGHNKQFLDI